MTQGGQGLGAPNLVGGAGSGAGVGVDPHVNGTGGGSGGVPLGSVPATMPRNARDMKSRMFSAQNKQRKFKRVMFFGEEVEIKQSSLGQVVAMANMKDDDDNDQGVAIYVLLNYAYVPGTEERVFDESDVEQLKSMPFGEDFNNITDAWREITGIKIEAATKN